MPSTFALQPTTCITTPPPTSTKQRFVYASILHKASPSDPGHYVAHASSLQRALRDPLKAAARPTSDRAASAEVGRLLAERARGVGGIESVHFRRAPGQRFAGKLKALVESIRQAGLPVK